MTYVLCALVTTRIWWLMARDQVTSPLWTRIEDRGGWLADGWSCGWCASMWWGAVVAGVTWHAVEPDGPWWWWMGTSTFVSSLVCAVVVTVVDRLDQ